ncbi:sporulation protein YabP [Paenibacillus yanchengensis]|uniref:Sporulation protein YabP n=1 Tax=Paenibacillus yanchengensis TaxID=2035833 RepID=A0ABW4YID1_9BACL
MVEMNKSAKQQQLKLVNRKLLELTGVLQVESFDSEQFLLETNLGYLSVEGHNLHMKQLSLEEGLVIIEGYIHSLAYRDAATSGKSKGILGKLFK